VVVGEAVRRTKLRYFLEAPRLDQYDEKTIQQWTLFGLPMYAVRTGIGSGSGPKGAAPWWRGPRPKAGSEHQRFGAVTVDLHVGNAKSSLPPFLTQLNAHFDFSAPGVYIKYNALADVIDDPSPGCPHPGGCYYTLNGLVERGTGTADLPIHPYFIYDSRLSGTSQHGVLWMGGVYAEEDGWIPVIAELVSNGGDFSDHGSTPRIIRHRPRPRRRYPAEGEGPSCRPSDLELNTLVLTTGEALKDDESDPEYNIERLYREIDLEVFYFNNTVDGSGNCDREGPTLLPSPFGEDYHQVLGRKVEWAVPASDAGGVWRVVVVWDDEAEDTWRPIELEDDGTGTWRGSLTALNMARLTYFIQAADRRGNVTWLDYVPTDLPASGVSFDIPRSVDIVFSTTSSADLDVRVDDSPDPVTANEAMAYTITVSNLGPDTASTVTLTCDLPPEASYVFANGAGWSCREALGELTCMCESLASGGRNRSPAPFPYAIFCCRMFSVSSA